MTQQEIATRRLHNQHLSGTPPPDIASVVRHFCAVQSQDYHGAKWALAQRTTGADDAALDRAFNNGVILRTHAMRPTWHFVLPEDIRWLQMLTGPRVHTVNGFMYRTQELDEKIITRCKRLIERALRDGNHLTRTELATVLERGGITASGQRLAYIMMHAELDALVCSGPLRGRQFTYALLDERAPAAPHPDRDDALAELTRRYFTGHGPATVHDMAWWSGLTVADVKRGVAMLRGELVSEESEGKVYWMIESDAPSLPRAPLVHLLPNYDEHLVAYRDHAPSLDPRLRRAPRMDGNALSVHIITLNGLVVGSWRRSVERKRAVVAVDLLVPLRRAERAALQQAAEEYGRFMGMAVEVVEG